MKAAEVLSRLREVYSNATSYTDECAAKAVLRGYRTVTSDLTMKTAFQRPRLKLDFCSRSSPLLVQETGWVVSDRNENIYGSMSKAETRYSSLSDALGTAIGRGATQACSLAPALLLPDEHCSDIFDNEYALYPDQSDHGKQFFKLGAKHATFGFVELSVCQIDFTLRHVRMSSQELSGIAEQIRSNTSMANESMLYDTEGDLLHKATTFSDISFECSYTNISISTR